MEDSIFIIFIAFGCLWILMFAGAIVLFFNSEGRQEIRCSKWGLIVALPIVIPIVITLVYAAVRR